MTNEKLSPSHNQLIDSDRVTEVAMKGWEASDESHTVLFTHGLGPCIGITIFDPATKRGFMGHIANPALEAATLDDMFAAVRSNVQDPSILRVWIRGGQTDEAMAKSAQEGMGIDFPQMGRDIIEERIKDLMGSAAEKADIQYDPAPMFGNSATMQRLDTETGEFVSRAYSTGEYQMTLGMLAMQ